MARRLETSKTIHLEPTTRMELVPLVLRDSLVQTLASEPIRELEVLLDLDHPSEITMEWELAMGNLNYV